MKAINKEVDDFGVGGGLTRMKAAGSIKPFELFIDYTMNVVLKP